MRYDVVLINADFNKDICNGRMCVPLGILYLGAVLKKHGFKIKLLDYNLAPKSNLEIEKELRDADGAVYAITSLSSGYTFVRNIIKIIKMNFPDRSVVVGGAITYGIPELILNQTGADIVVEGEAENIIAPLINELVSKPASVTGKKVIGFKQANVPQDLDALPFPDWSLIDAEGYINRCLHSWLSAGMRSFVVSASRGCPYSCNFCCKSLGGKVRLRSGRSILEEIQVIVDRYAINDILFIDEEFALNENRIIELCEAINLASERLTFACSMRVDIVTGRILRRMKAAGCRRIIYGVESGSQRIIDAMGKGFIVSDAEKAITLTREHGIEAYANFMFAYPGESEATIRETFDFMKRMSIYAGFGLATPLPGTRLFDRAVQDNKICDVGAYLEKLEIKFASSMAVNVSDLSDRRLALLKEECREQLFSKRIVMKE